jgi:hypothetical protein
MVKILRRPIMSAARPPASRKPANASVYALATHCTPGAENPRADRIVGVATLTTAMSITTISCPVTATRVIQRSLPAPAPRGSATRQALIAMHEA